MRASALQLEPARTFTCRTFLTYLSLHHAVTSPDLVTPAVSRKLYSLLLLFHAIVFHIDSIDSAHQIANLDFRNMPIGHLYWYALSFLLCGLYSHSHFDNWPNKGYGPHKVSALSFTYP